jgi:hypothetical protein
MRKYIDSILTTTLEGLIAILCVLVIICGIVACALVVMGMFMAIFGEHDAWWIRIIGIVILCYLVGKLISI